MVIQGRSSSVASAKGHTTPVWYSFYVQVTDKLFAEVDVALAKAEAAIKAPEQMLAQARKDLQYLQGKLDNLPPNW